MPNIVQFIQQLVAPVVMISACGLLCLALYNRLAVVVTRLRGFNYERFTVTGRLGRLGPEARTGARALQLQARLDMLERQVESILARARLLRNALISLILGALCMLACSLAIGISILAFPAQFAAIGLFLVGVASMFVGMLLALIELTRSLDPVTIERDSMPAYTSAAGRNPAAPAPARTASPER